MTAPLHAVEFRHALDNSPLDLSPLPGEELTQAVKTFQETGDNGYIGNETALAEGKDLYSKSCLVCHPRSGSGGMGPSLVSGDTLYPRVKTDVGMFEVIHSGASGAMRSFAKRGMTQDQILKIIAYVRSIKKDP